MKLSKTPSEALELTLQSPVEITTVDLSSNPEGLTFDDIEFDGEELIFTVDGGVHGNEYQIEALINDDTLVVEFLVVLNLGVRHFQYYGSVIGSDQYIFNDDWGSIENEDRRLLLIQATRMIENLNFRGFKSFEDQELQFPRDGHEEIPENIQLAAYEIASKIADGFDLEFELENFNVTRDKYGPIETTYDRNRIFPEHLLAGIPSYKAWTYLRPYLRDPREIIISRDS